MCGQQQLFCMLHPHIGEIAVWRHADMAAEKPVQVIFAQAYLCRNFIQRNIFRNMRFHKADCLFYRRADGGGGTIAGFYQLAQNCMDGNGNTVLILRVCLGTRKVQQVLKDALQAVCAGIFSSAP